MWKCIVDRSRWIWRLFVCGGLSSSSRRLVYGWRLFSTPPPGLRYRQWSGNYLSGPTVYSRLSANAPRTIRWYWCQCQSSAVCHQPGPLTQCDARCWWIRAGRIKFSNCRRNITYSMEYFYLSCLLIFISQLRTGRALCLSLAEMSSIYKLAFNHFSW